MINLTYEEKIAAARQFAEAYRKKEMRNDNAQDGYVVEEQGYEYAWELIRILEVVILNKQSASLA